MAKKSTKPSSPQAPGESQSEELLKSIIQRIHVHAMNMIYVANHREDVEKGDPKVGGHPSACSSALHLLSTLHLVTRQAVDVIAVKPHASPVDHTNHYLLDLLFEKDGVTPLSADRAKQAMKNLRHFSHSGEPVFQSYHSAFDPDHFNFLPSGSVGIPPVNALYLAAAYEMAKTQGFKVPADAHFWCLMGDSEFREGSLTEAMPEAAERGLGHLTWIVDYNRQSLDGHRILNEEGLGGKDCDRIERMAVANGWDVLQLRHGRFRQSVFGVNSDGEALQGVMETALTDYEFNSLLANLLAGGGAKTLLEALGRYDKAAVKALKALSEEDIVKFMMDLGGHDLPLIQEAYQTAKKDSEKPMLLVAHTVKGWGLECAVKSANHSAMMSVEEVQQMREKAGLKKEDLFAFEKFSADSQEGLYLKNRGQALKEGMSEIREMQKSNRDRVYEVYTKTGADKSLPSEIGVNLKLVPMAHTQWVLGQISAKLGRIGDTSLDESKLKSGQKPLSEQERKWKVAGDLLVTMAPDVGTSTNLNASMDGKIFAPETEDFEEEYGVKDTKSPDIVPSETEHSKHIRFDIAECNTMSCAGSFGKMGEFLGVPFMPVMTVYDFFIKRALDQLFYNAYWKSNFILVGTPSGVTLSPEGAQHAWKSDIQIAGLLTWEPTFGIEMDWIFAESFRRHIRSSMGSTAKEDSVEGRAGVLIRCVTRSLEQKLLLSRLKTQKRFEGRSDPDILENTRKDCLSGAYYLVDHRGQKGYQPGENVVHIFSMGALVTEALSASDQLLKDGIFANVIVVSSNDLLLGNHAYQNNFEHLKKGLGITGDLYLSALKQNLSAENIPYPPQTVGPRPGVNLKGGAVGSAQLLSLGGRRVPVVSVHDGEPGLLDNLGSVLGTLQKALAVRKHSKSGRPSDIYAYHGLDSVSIRQAALGALEESAFTPVHLALGQSPFEGQLLGRSID